MRPSTLKEAVERLRDGDPRGAALAEFVDTFLLAPDADARYATIETEPPPSGDARLDALAGAVAEYLAKQYRLGRVPAWVSRPQRRLDEPWFTTSSFAPAMREYLSVRAQRNSAPTISSPRSSRCGARAAICPMQRWVHHGMPSRSRIFA
jgi:hypothetical protein